MKVHLSKNVIDKFPGLNFKVLVIKNMNNQRRASVTTQLLRGASAKLMSESKKVIFKEKFQQIITETTKEGSTLLESYLLSSKIKKLSTNKEITPENNLHDLLQYLSLRYLTPIYGFDLDDAEKDYTIDFIQPKRGKKIQDITCTKDTHHFVLWLADLHQLEIETFEALPQEIEKVITKYCGGMLTEMYDLNIDQPTFDLNYISEKENLYLQKAEEEEREMEFVKAQAQEQKIQEETQLEESAIETSSEIFQTNNQFVADPSMKDRLVLIIQDALRALGLQDGAEEWLSKVEIGPTKDPKHGDYACNIAMKLGKALSQNPIEVAEKLKEKITQVEDIQKVEVAAPGFLNITLSASYFEKELKKILAQKAYFGHINVGKGEKVMIEYSSPNIAKPLGVHHLITTLLGQSLVNLHKAAGYEVVSANFPGNVGTQFGKIIYAIRTWGNQEEINKNPIPELLKLYVKFGEEAEKDPSLEDIARTEYKKIEEHDPENYKMWQWINEISLEDLKKEYTKLGVKFDKYYPESDYVEAGKTLVEEGMKQGIFTVGEKGAIVANFEEEGLATCVVQKSDGTTLYLTRDLAALHHRIQDTNTSKYIYVVQAAQTLHFRQLFATAKKLHLTNAELKHVPFGLMKVADGNMSTRNGTMVLVNDLIEEGFERAKKLLAEKNKENELPATELKRLGYGVALGAIKYAFVCQNPDTDMLFAWDKLLTFDGNSAPYLQYSYARTSSILRKSAETPKPKKEKVSDQTDLFSIAEDRKADEEANLKPFEKAEEQALLRALVRLPEIIEDATKAYKPNLLSNYLYALAQTFNSFYQAVPVLTTQNEELLKTRLQLVEATGTVLRNGLTILGIPVFERM